MRWILSLGLALALVLSAGSAALAASPDGTQPSTALPLIGSATLGLTGATSGAFRYLQFDSPGNGSVSSITLHYAPTDPVTANAVGLHLWQAGALLGTVNGVSATPGTNTLSISSSASGPVLVQIFNYTNGEPVTFTVDLAGATPAATAPGPATPILEFNTMFPVSGPYVGTANPIRGINGGGLPWAIATAQGELQSSGRLDVNVTGLVLASGPHTGTNPITNFKAIVSCRTLSAGSAAVANVSTGLFPATATGDSHIVAQVALPSPCLAPLVFVTSPTGAWFAVTGR
jgi:hypothetical protein